jgi:hypothetical protein
MPTNEEYLQRWEEAAPTPVASDLTPEEIAKMQGTRNSDKPSWQTYDKEMMGDVEDAALLEAMAEYASRGPSGAEATNQTKEELARLREASAEQVKEYQWLSPDEYKNEKERIGHIMHSVVFLNKLQKAGVNCWYRSHPQAGKITLVVQRAALPPEVGCWCQEGFAPELSIMRFDDHGIPLAEKYRGWRTPLLQLILKGVISEKKADEIFGKPKTTPAFHRYNSTLRRFRDAGSRLEN